MVGKSVLVRFAQSCERSLLDDVLRRLAVLSKQGF